MAGTFGGGGGAEKSLHSRYDPRREAERYVDSLSIREDVRCLILVEPGLGYCVPPLKKRFPRARIIALHVSPPGAGVPPENRADARWESGGGVPAQQFLEGEVPETGAALVKIVEWRPARGVFGEKYLRLLGECAEFIKRLDAGERTLRQFGGRWFRNFFRNIALIRKTVSLPPLSCPLVIAGAGPSLEASLPLLRRLREGLFILGVSSAGPALEAGGVRPDLLVSTDGGNWALSHLRESLRGGGAPALAASLNAALPSQCGEGPLLFMSDGSLWQRLALEAAGIPYLCFPQRGTVSAAALDLGFFMSRGKVFITGLDLGHRDIRAHARPYAFDRLWEEGASRLNPAYHRHFVRGGEITRGGSQGVYAAWFRQQLALWPRRLFSLGGNNPVFRDLEIREGDLEGACGEGGGRPVLREIPLGAPGDAPERAREVLRGALRDPRYGELLQTELGSARGAFNGLGVI